MPLAEALVALAALAGNTVVTAAVTDAWEGARKGFARLLGRGDPGKTRLAEERLADLLEEDPGAEAELRALVAQIQAALPAGMASAAGHAVAAGRDVNITASGGGIAAGVIHGDVTPPGPTRPGPVGG